MIAGVPSLQPISVPVTITVTSAPSPFKEEDELVQTPESISSKPIQKVLSNITNSIPKQQDGSRSVSFQTDPHLGRVVKSSSTEGISGSTPGTGFTPGIGSTPGTGSTPRTISKVAVFIFSQVFTELGT